jgi:hypothetical protein
MQKNLLRNFYLKKGESQEFALKQSTLSYFWAHY